MANMDTQQNVFSISEAKIAKITSNTSENYETSERVEVPELSTMDVTVELETKDATYGAGIIADSFTIKKGFAVKFESVNIPIKAIALINGLTLVESETANKITEKTTDIPVNFNLEFKTDFVNGDPADFHMELFNTKGYIDIITKADDYWTCSFNGKAAARKKDKAIREITANKEATAITTPAG